MRGCASCAVAVQRCDRFVKCRVLNLLRCLKNTRGPMLVKTFLDESVLVKALNKPVETAAALIHRVLAA